MLEDETPASADESPLEADWGPPKQVTVGRYVWAPNGGFGCLV